MLQGFLIFCRLVLGAEKEKWVGWFFVSKSFFHGKEENRSVLWTLLLDLKKTLERVFEVQTSDVPFT